MISLNSMDLSLNTKVSNKSSKLSLKDGNLLSHLKRRNSNNLYQRIKESYLSITGSWSCKVGVSLLMPLLRSVKYLFLTTSMQ